MDETGFEKWLESEDGQTFIQKQHEKLVLKEKRHRRFEEWLKNNDFDKLLNRLVLEHNDKYQDKCYDRGYQPYPNRKLSFLIGYLVDNMKTIYVKELNCDFPNQIWEFNNYYFQLIHGQGTIFRLYKKEDLNYLLQV